MRQDDLRRSLEALHAESFGWALACCDRRREDAEDVLQTAYLKVLEGSARFAERSSFRTWLFGVIRKTAWDVRRRRWLRHQLLALFPVAAPAAVERAAETSDLIAALGKLAERQREVLTLVFYHDMSLEEAAEVMGVS